MDRTSIRASWGAADDAPGFTGYTVSIEPSGTRVINNVQREVVFSNLIPGELYNISVVVLTNTGIMTSVLQRTSM